MISDDSFEDTVHNQYGDVRNDNPVLIQKQPIWNPVVTIIGFNIVTNLFDTYITKDDFIHVGFASWGRNLKAGFPWGPSWVWDQDRFGMNFLGHPYSGGEYFIAARANGYNFWESIPFTFFGSYMWKIFGETGIPERNDLICTTIGGALFGEILYRLSSNVLDDRTTGMERFFRELSGAVLAPTRAWTRLTEGKLFKVTSEDTSQREPLNMALSAGIRRVNNGSSFLTGSSNFFLNINFDYGNPFEVRPWKPFDYFKMRTDLTIGAGRKLVDEISGYGLLFGKNVESGDLKTLVGVFQHWDYFDNWTFELGTMAFGPGIITKLPVSSNSNLYTNIHIGVVPFAGNSTRYGPDTSQIRDYDFGGGAESKFECTLNLGSRIRFTFVGSYFWFHTYVGSPGDNYIGVLKPSIGLRLFNNLSVGVEHLVYYSDRFTRNYGDFHQVRTEQRVNLTLSI
jgi:hypothetical protein